MLLEIREGNGCRRKCVGILIDVEGTAKGDCKGNLKECEDVKGEDVMKERKCNRRESVGRV